MKKFHENDYNSVSFNSLWPSDAKWWHRSGWTLVQVMACCLMAPSNYLNQCWLIIKGILWHSSESNLTRTVNLIHDIYLEITHSKSLPYLPGANELNLGFLALCISKYVAQRPSTMDRNLMCFDSHAHDMPGNAWRFICIPSKQILDKNLHVCQWILCEEW